jgi:hypothetical protein
MQQRPNAIMLRLRPQGEHDVVEQAARLEGKPPSTWARDVVVAAARRLVRGARERARRERSQPGVGEALETMRSHLSTMIGGEAEWTRR